MSIQFFVEEVVGKYTELGVEFTLAGADLDVTAPQGALSDLDWRWIERHKAEILELLRTGAEAVKVKTSTLLDFKSLIRPLPFTGRRRCPVEGCDEWLSFIEGQANCPGCRIEITIIAPGLHEALCGYQKEGSA